jgi:hypothetical protein
MRPAAYEQLSQPESEIAISVAEVLAMLEVSSMGEIFVQAAVLLISVMMTSANVFTY